MCFLNSHATVLAAGCEALLGALGPGVGVAGATGSYEAPRTINPLRSRRWPRFPNPHIRTNGFILERSLMQSLRWPDVTTSSRRGSSRAGALG